MKTACFLEVPMTSLIYMVYWQKGQKIPPWIKLGFGLILLGLATFFFVQSRLGQRVNVDFFIRSVEEIRNHGWGWIFFYVLYSVAIIACPITLFPIVGGVLFNFWIAFPLNVLATIVGSFLAFKLARFLGQETLEKMFKGRFDTLNTSAKSIGFWWVVGIRWIGFPPFIIANVAFGISRVKTKDFIIGTLVGILPWLAFLTYAANSLWETVLVSGKDGLTLAVLHKMGPFMGVSVLMMGIIIGTNYLLKRRAHLKKQPI